MSCIGCGDSGIELKHDGRPGYCSCCYEGSRMRIASNRRAITAYRENNMEPICSGPFPDDSMQPCAGQILTSLSLMERCSRRVLVRVVCSHPGCESVEQVDRELEDLIAAKKVGIEPDWDSLGGWDDIVYHIATSEAPLTKEQEAACKMQKMRGNRRYNIGMLLGAVALFVGAVLYAVAHYTAR